MSSIRPDVLPVDTIVDLQSLWPVPPLSAVLQARLAEFAKGYTNAILTRPRLPEDRWTRDGRSSRVRHEPPHLSIVAEQTVAVATAVCSHSHTSIRPGTAVGSSTSSAPSTPSSQASANYTPSISPHTHSSPGPGTSTTKLTSTTPLPALSSAANTSRKRKSPPEPIDGIPHFNTRFGPTHLPM